MDIRLRPLRDDEFERYLAEQRVEYVRSLVDEAGMTPETAEEKSRADHASLFPDGVRQEHQRISAIEDTETAEAVGRLFWAPRGEERAFIYDLFIDERLRGRGLGRKALELIEEEACAERLRGIDLNVWGGNDAARALYRAAGYDERAVFMSKDLA